MASHVVVIDSTARRHTIKCTPAKHLSDILHEACGKFGVNPQQYGLKHNNKKLDLSLSIRHSGMINGAKLSLVQASRSPSVVSVALQLPTSGDVPGSRLTDKFPSDTPLWQILRRFEDGTAGAAGSTGKTNYNFTQRATPVTIEGTSGSGRLNYEMPVVNIMGRELSTFVDLQKTLAQLGFNSGSCLIRLNYKDSGEAMSEAMEKITEYFKSIEPPAPTSTTDTHGAHGRDVGEAQSSISANGADQLDNIAGERVKSDDQTTESTINEPDVSVPSAPTTPGGDSPMPDFNDTTASTSQPPQTSRAATEPPSTSISIFAPPTLTTSHTIAESTYSENDYLPTLDHAQLHQARLAASSQNRKLLSDAELAAAEQARKAKLGTIKDVLVRIRFPDQSMAQRSFGQDATVADVYSMCRQVMQAEGESFGVKVPSGARGGGMATLTEAGDGGQKKLIKDLLWQGRVMVTIVWGENVSQETRSQPCLKQEYRAVAEEIKIPQAEQEEPPSAKATTENKVEDKPKKKVDKESKMRGLLKGLSKK